MEAWNLKLQHNPNIEALTHLSHDIRTPIAGMSGMIQNLLNRTNAISMHQELEELSRDELLTTLADLTKTIQSNGALLMNSTNELLNLCNSVLTMPHTKTQKNENFYLTRLISNIKRLLSPVAKNQNLNLLFYIDPSIPASLKGKAPHLNRILINLISNALKFTNSGFVKLSIYLKNPSIIPLKHNTIMLEIIVSDSGCGIEKKHIDQIFNKFSTFKQSKHHKSSGLGLYTVKKYLEQLNGSIQVDSKTNSGTKFTLNIPFEIEKKTTNNKILPHTKDSSNQTKSKKILLVEDNLTLKMAMELVLEDIGCMFDTAQNGRQAIEKAKNEAYDLILMDLGLPDMSGIEATKNIQAFSVHIPTIALTGYQAEDRWQECKAVGMQDIITKPIEVEALKALLQKI